MVKTKDHLIHKRTGLETSKQLNEELLAWVPTNQLLATTDPSVAPPSYDAEGGSTETQCMLAPYKDSDIIMSDIDDLVVNNLYS